MAKVAEDAALELPINDDRLEPKRGRHVTIALNHMQKQRDALTKKINSLSKERDGLDQAIDAIK